MILQHGTIHTMAGETIEQGYIVIQNGVIEQVGTGDLLHVEDEDIIDLKGAHVNRLHLICVPLMPLIQWKIALERRWKAALLLL